jgi:hypothetical protein
MRPNGDMTERERFLRDTKKFVGFEGSDSDFDLYMKAYKAYTEDINDEYHPIHSFKDFVKSEVGKHYYKQIKKEERIKKLKDILNF